MSVIVQYVLIRGDLIKTLNWPVGAVVAQACHASTAVIHMFYNDPCTQSYLMDLDSMHKIILEVPNEEALKKLSETLNENAVSHKLWIEQPENYATCLAVKPFPKEEIQTYFKKFKYFKENFNGVNIRKDSRVKENIKVVLHEWPTILQTEEPVIHSEFGTIGPEFKMTVPQRNGPTISRKQ